MARFKDLLILLHSDATLWAVDAQTGQPVYGKAQPRGAEHPLAAMADVLYPGDVRAQHKGDTNVKISPMCLASGKDFLVVTYFDHDAVHFLSPDDGSVLSKVTVPKPRDVAVAPDGRVFVISDRQVVRVNRQERQNGDGGVRPATDRADHPPGLRRGP